MLTANTVIGPEALPDEIVKQPGQPVEIAQPYPPPTAIPTAPPSGTPGEIIPLKELERRAIVDALTQVGYNATQTAKQLGISKATLYRKLKEYRISRRLILWS
ncbi:MAG: helix-turn-helix domain-containing protein [Deltaproteobacteria bacterium]|nr:helix-turn-helix domain-containing protein [Deltaproteobacteria bacterium]